MSVDLSNLIPSFQYEISPPGTNAFPNMGDDEAVGRLMDAFWEMRLMGIDFLQAFTCDSNGIITPLSNVGIQGYAPSPGWYTDDGSGDLGQEIQQAIVLFAGYRAVSTQYMNLQTSVAYKAGAVSYEAQQSAQVLQIVFKAMTAKIDIVLTRLSDLGSTSVEVLDAVIDNTINIMNGSSWFVRGSIGGGNGGMAGSW